MGTAAIARRKSYSQLKNEAISLQDELRRREQEAADYERLTAEAANQRGRIRSLEKQAVDVTPLEAIVELCNGLPPSILTGTTKSLAFTIPSHVVARDVLGPIAAGALANVRRREGERVQQIEEAKARLAEAEKQISEFGE